MPTDRLTEGEKKRDTAIQANRESREHWFDRLERKHPKLAVWVIVTLAASMGIFCIMGLILGFGALVWFVL